jgi:hypothetical protein
MNGGYFRHPLQSLTKSASPSNSREGISPALETGEYNSVIHSHVTHGEHGEAERRGWASHQRHANFSHRPYRAALL